MGKAIERFLFITACCSLLAVLPLHSAHAQESAPALDVAIASHFTPDVAAPPATIGIAPIDMRRETLGSCASRPGGSCLDIHIFEPERGDPPCGFECRGNQ